MEPSDQYAGPTGEHMELIGSWWLRSPLWTNVSTHHESSTDFLEGSS